MDSINNRRKGRIRRCPHGDDKEGKENEVEEDDDADAAAADNDADDDDEKIIRNNSNSNSNGNCERRGCNDGNEKRRRIDRIELPTSERILSTMPSFLFLLLLSIITITSSSVVVVDAWVSSSSPTSSSSPRTRLSTTKLLLQWQRHDPIGFFCCGLKGSSSRSSRSYSIIPNSLSSASLESSSLLPSRQLLLSQDNKIINKNSIRFSTTSTTRQSSSSSSSSSLESQTSSSSSTESTEEDSIIRTNTRVQVRTTSSSNTNRTMNTRRSNSYNNSKTTTTYRPRKPHYNSTRYNKARHTINELFQSAKLMERQGRWGKASTLLEKILEINPNDAHTHLALARLEARRERKPHQGSIDIIGSSQQTKAQRAFERGVTACPRNVHLLQAWAIYESQQHQQQQSQHNHNHTTQLERARELFEQALHLKPYNPYICHAYSFMERKIGNNTKAISLLERSINAPYGKVTAAVVCSLGELYISVGNTTTARELYHSQLERSESESESSSTAAIVSSSPSTSTTSTTIGSSSSSFDGSDNGDTTTTATTKRPTTTTTTITRPIRSRISRQKHLPTVKDRVEVYLAAAWLEERHYHDYHNAHELLHKAVTISRKTSSLALVALARFEGRHSEIEFEVESESSSATTTTKISNTNTTTTTTTTTATTTTTNPSSRSKTKTKKATKKASSISTSTSISTTEMANMATKKRLSAICDELYQQGQLLRLKEIEEQQQNQTVSSSLPIPIPTTTKNDENENGRVFNALASLEIQQRNFKEAREVLQKGILLYPDDYHLVTAAGKVEEHVGNYTSARYYYSEALKIQPSAPTLVAYALLELKYPQQSQYPTSVSLSASSPVSSSTEQQKTATANFTLIRGLFEEALLLDPRNGPVYNAYGNAEVDRGNIEQARNIFERGTLMNCSDSASLYHGYGMLELSAGNVERAKEILSCGVESVTRNEDRISSDIPHRGRAAFLSHTLGMLELHQNRPTQAWDIFQDGLARCGNSSQLLVGAALCAMRTGHEDVARTFLERAIVADATHAQAWQAWGVMETKAGHFHRASELFQLGIKQAPESGALWHGYASLEVRRDNIANARTLFTAGLQKAQPRDHNGLFQGWAKLELREGNYEKARQLISEALTRHKTNGRGWMIAAQIELEDGHAGLAELLLRRGIELVGNTTADADDPPSTSSTSTSTSSSNAELYRMLGTHLLQHHPHRVDEARQVYEQGIAVNPMYAPLYHSLAELEAQLFNLAALSKLNKRTNALFTPNNNKNNEAGVTKSSISLSASAALTPSQSPSPPQSKSQSNISIGETQQTKNKNLPQQGKTASASATTSKVVSALADKRVDDADNIEDEIEAGTNAADVNRSRSGEADNYNDVTTASQDLNEDGLVGDMMSVESILDDTDTTTNNNNNSKPPK